jgi:hypothetical protein
MTQKEDINQLKKKNNTPAHHFATPKPYPWVKNFKTLLAPMLSYIGALLYQLYG